MIGLAIAVSPVVVLSADCDVCVQLATAMERRLSTAVSTEDVIHTIELLLSDLGRCSALLEIAPVYRRQQESWDKVLKIISHLLYLVTQLTRAPVLELPLRKKIHRLVHVMDPRTTQGDSLLHLAVSKSNSLKTQNFFEDGGQMGNLFPSLPVARMLVECGARINATNAVESTPLHTASCLVNFKQEVVTGSCQRQSLHLDIICRLWSFFSHTELILT